MKYLFFSIVLGIVIVIEALNVRAVFLPRVRKCCCCGEETTETVFNISTGKRAAQCKNCSEHPTALLYTDSRPPTQDEIDRVRRSARD
jgi:hypothetical protein